MASWCGSTRSFCREQKPQGKRCGENMPTELRSLGREQEDAGTCPGTRGWKAGALKWLRAQGPLLSILDTLVKR